MKKSNAKILYLVAGLFGILGFAFTGLMLYLEYLDPEITLTKDTIITNIVLGCIGLIVAVLHIVVFFIKEEKLYHQLSLLRALMIMNIFGNVISFVLGIIAYNRIKTNALIASGFDPKSFYMNFVNQNGGNSQKEKEEEKTDVIDAEAKVVSEETPKENMTMQDELDALNRLYEEKKIDADEYYARKNKILSKYYGN